MALHQKGFVAAQKHMATASAQAIEALRVNAIEVSHPSCQFGLRRFDQQILVAGHLALDVARPLEALADVSEHASRSRPLRPDHATRIEHNTAQCAGLFCPTRWRERIK